MARRPTHRPAPNRNPSAGGGERRMPPDGEVRRSQLLTTYGPGALVDLVQHAVVVGGLDQWRYAEPNSGFIAEERLQADLLPRMKSLFKWSGTKVRLREPPDCSNDDPKFGRGIGTRIFPRWFVCQNDLCHSLVHERGLDANGRHVCTYGAKGVPVVPVRFLMGCPAGHIDDISWNWWIHNGQRDPNLPEELVAPNVYCQRDGASKKHSDPLGAQYTSPLYLHMTGTSSGLADQVAGCRNCGASRKLIGLSIKGALGSCQGNRPWLRDRETCPDPKASRLLTRTASNVYFPQRVSVLSIPDPAHAVAEAVERNWAFLDGVSTLEDLRQRLQIPILKAQLVDKDGNPLDEVLLLDAIHARIAGKSSPLPRIRQPEWWAFMKAPPERPGERPPKGERWFARKANLPDLPPFVERVVLAHNVTEVQAQYAFTRLDSPTPDAEGEVALGAVQPAPLSLHTGRDEDWVPAVEIFGEGVFIAFNIEHIRAWEARPAVKARQKQFMEAFERYNARQQNQNRLVVFPGVRLFMLHTLSHLLIQAIALDAGYPVSALRERLYCHTDTHAGEERAGIFIHTGTPGTEGTLGGLIEAGRHIARHLRQVADLAELCANDPVCAQHEPDLDQEDRLRHGAACHACLLISEPSCERMNRDLDRTLVVPTLHEAEAAFLGPWLRGLPG